MKAARLAAMARDAIGFDTETHLIQPGLLAPPMVCGSFATPASPGATTSAITDQERTRRVFGAALDRNDRHLNPAIICGANVAYDMLVMGVDAARQGVDLLPRIFEAYGVRFDADGFADSRSASAPDGRVFDVQVAEALHAIAEGTLGQDPRTGKPTADPATGKASGRYSLAICTDLVLGRVDAKANDRFRLSYALLEGTPLEAWPDEARQYPIDDAVNTLEVALAQAGHIPGVGPHEWVAPPTGADGVCPTFACARCGVAVNDPDRPRGCALTKARRNLACHSDEVFTSWALHLGAAWGLRTDPEAIDALERAALVGRTKNADRWIELGYVRPNGTEDQKAVKTAVALAYGADPLSACGVCSGTGKVPSEKTGKPVNCGACSSTGMDLAGGAVPLTEPSKMYPNGTVKIGRDTLIESGDETLMAYGESQEDDKILDTYIPKLREGVAQPVTLSPNNPLETGRVSYLGIWQLLPRMVSARLLAVLKEQGARVQGVRDCVVPRPGNSFFSNDLKGGELVAFAEACVQRVGFSRMGEALRTGRDVHSALGAYMMNVPYERFLKMLEGDEGPDAQSRAKRFRQAAKPENFGNPGGMGAAKKVITQRMQGPDTPCANGPSMVDDGAGHLVPGYKGLRFCIIMGAERCGVVKVTEWRERPITPTCRACIEIAEAGKAAWKQQWPEAQPYLDWHGRNVDEVGEVRQINSPRIRGGADYCAEANGDFQGLLADVAKAALRRVCVEQYLRSRVYSSEHAAGPSAYEGGPSPLYGSRTVIFAHDELFGECPTSIGHDVSARINEIMIEEFRRLCPNHKEACGAEPTLMPRWYKAASPVYHDDRLVEWSPEHAAATKAGACAPCAEQKARNKARAASVVKG